jgi:hypothetical protein
LKIEQKSTSRIGCSNLQHIVKTQNIIFIKTSEEVKNKRIKYKKFTAKITTHMHLSAPPQQCVHAQACAIQGRFPFRLQNLYYERNSTDLQMAPFQNTLSL